MRLITFEHDGKTKIGVERGTKVVDIAAATRAYGHLTSEMQLSAYAAAVAGDLKAFLQQGEQGLDFVRSLMGSVNEQEQDIQTEYLLSAADIQLRAPLLRPGKIVCVGKNYRDHAVEMHSELPITPIIFAKFANVISDPDAKVMKPIQSNQLDYEAELAVIIGKTGRRIRREVAYEYIAGYSCFNDLSVRDYQMRTSQWLQGKTFDGSGPFGPALVTKDEILDPQNLDIRCYVNGEVRQQANTRQMIFDLPFLIEFISGIMTLEPGDVIATGTPSGVAAGMRDAMYLQVGDEVVVDIEQIGQLRNFIVSDVMH